ncbi:MAG: DNA recombination protein RmuC [Gammaproteobacteria bacterium]|nr:DNA recombination protein RmuC [Gammaproteobacteria bacterium]
MTGLTQATDERLKEISGQVEKRLADGFEKTTQTFQDVLKRLALIDDAQKKITELSSNVVSLQEILADKRSRGAFGEVQLESLVKNVMPTNAYQFQYSFSNKKIVDCALFLPDPTGTIGVDAKFPLENFQKMMDHDLSEIERRQAQSQFVKDVKKHINDIASKYIIERETAPGAVMFIPAEAIFAEIHAHHPGLVEYAQQSKVWMVSPTTMMALLTTASAVLKDEATRKQVHIIQEHLAMLSKDFGRFKTRMTNLSRHIDNVTKDVKEITTSADKISSRFDKIEQVQLPEEDLDPRLKVESVKKLESK